MVRHIPLLLLSQLFVGTDSTNASPAEVPSSVVAWIQASHPASERRRAAALQLAADTRGMLEVSASKTQISNAARRLRDSTECLHQIFGDREEATVFAAELNRRVVAAQREANGASLPPASDTGQGSIRPTKCRFDPAKLPN